MQTHRDIGTGSRYLSQSGIARTQISNFGAIALMIGTRTRATEMEITNFEINSSIVLPALLICRSITKGIVRRLGRYKCQNVYGKIGQVRVGPRAV
jgi:hypothetical protein